MTQYGSKFIACLLLAQKMRGTAVRFDGLSNMCSNARKAYRIMNLFGEYDKISKILSKPLTVDSTLLLGVRSFWGLFWLVFTSFLSRFTHFFN